VPLIAAAAVAAGAALQSATGFGFALIAAPLVFATVEPQEAVGLMIVLSLEMNLLTLLGERRRPQPAWRDCLVILGFSLPGAVAGVYVLRALDPVALQIAVSVGVIATLIVRRVASGHHLPAWGASVSGFVAGGLTTSTTTAGPPLLVYLLGRDLDAAGLRDSLTACFLGLNVMGALALLVTGTTGAVPGALLLAILVPVVAIGQIAGRPLFHALADTDAFEPTVTAILLVSIVAGLATAVL